MFLSQNTYLLVSPRGPTLAPLARRLLLLHNCVVCLEKRVVLLALGVVAAVDKLKRCAERCDDTCELLGCPLSSLGGADVAVDGIDNLVLGHVADVCLADLDDGGKRRRGACGRRAARESRKVCVGHVGCDCCRSKLPETVARDHDHRLLGHLRCLELEGRKVERLGRGGLDRLCSGGKRGKGLLVVLGRRRRDSTLDCRNCVADVEDERGLLGSAAHLLPLIVVGLRGLLGVCRVLHPRVVAVALRVSLGSALEALDVGELLAGVLGVAAVCLLGLAAVLAEEADLAVAGHGWLVVRLVCCWAGKIPFITHAKSISIFCELARNS